ncbi:SUMO-specific isopeptidase USPL1 [Salminus brasiliensis]|uniref:SUMO-specific isopeptidase USPL1 n=1 Tax=Salminus brasiliensis TaxID=930266 RepID=UPI003B83980B
MNGEISGAGLASPALAGCLGKAGDRRLVPEECPWCSAKGQKSALRSYAINFKESITLCSSPLCLYPLVSRPLEDVRASLYSAADTKACKRKSQFSESENPSPKHQKKEESVIVSEAIDCRVSTESVEEKLFANGQEEQRVVENGVKNACTDTPAASTEDQVLSDVAQTENYVSSTQDETSKTTLTDESTQDFAELVPTRPHLFWRNKDNLCWLDSLLVALVHFSVFTEVPHVDASLTDNFPSKNCTVRSLCARYRKTCTYLKSKEKMCQDSVVKVPSDVLHKAEQELEALQLSVFQLLKTKLQCELGQKETPVFALPLLLKTDEWAHGLFQHTGQWEFTCTSCGYTLNTSVEKTVTTFTQLVTDWHPLRAVHRAQCSNCNHKNQRRKLFFQKLSPVLALHFVEGLPRRDVSRYSFDFQGTHYVIRTIIQYNEQLEHFVTWIHQADGSWLEFDDLKYPHYITHKRFTLRATQFHIVFWEAEARKELLEPIPEKDPTVVGNENVCFEDMANSVTNDACIIEALTTNEDMNEAASSLDSSIGSTTLLDTFEGLTHSDIVTLTLVEVKVDGGEKPLPNPQKAVNQPVESSLNESLAPQTNTTLFQAPATPKHKLNDAKDISLAPVVPELFSPSIVKMSPAATAADKAPQVSQHLPALLPSKPSVSNLSFLMQRHPSHNSTPLRVQCPASQPKLAFRCEVNEALPAKPAELFGGFKAKNLVLPDVSRQPLAKLPGSQLIVPLPQKSFCHSGGTTVPIQASEILKSAGKKAASPSATLRALSTTDALRIKLMKKLKAKKKKLAKLNQLLGKCEGQPTAIPDSTDLTSPYSVTSSTSVYSSPAYDHFFADLLSPATTSSNHSPDSTGLLEMITNSQGGETSDSSPPEKRALYKADFSASVLPEPPVKVLSSTNDDFFDEFISGSGVQQSAIENTDFNTLDMFF